MKLDKIMEDMMMGEFNLKTFLEKLIKEFLQDSEITYHKKSSINSIINYYFEDFDRGTTG